MKAEIASICQRYKKLIQDQKKDKEKLNLLVNQQKKQIITLEKRRETLTEDNNKIFSNFSNVIDQDAYKRNIQNLQNSIILSKKDLEVINCWYFKYFV